MSLRRKLQILLGDMDGEYSDDLLFVEINTIVSCLGDICTGLCTNDLMVATRRAHQFGDCTVHVVELLEIMGVDSLRDAVEKARAQSNYTKTLPSTAD